jgi:hypothetical protein
VLVEQFADVVDGAVGGGAAGVEQHRQRFEFQAQPSVQHGEQDPVGEGQGGWAALFDAGTPLV